MYAQRKKLIVGRFNINSLNHASIYRHLQEYTHHVFKDMHIYYGVYMLLLFLFPGAFAALFLGRGASTTSRGQCCYHILGALE